MFALLSSISFTAPMMLAGIIALPLLWYILRLTPPAPRKIFFPATFLLKGLYSKEKTPSSAPWWLLLLRLMMVALLIIALAKPVLNPSETLDKRGDLRLILDNGWASAPLWKEKIETAQGLIEQAARERRKVYIAPTTAKLGQDQIDILGPFTRDEALSALSSIKPNSWPSDYKLLAKEINIQSASYFYNIWLSDGITSQNSNAISTLTEALSADQSLEVKLPANDALPVLLRAAKPRAQTTDANSARIAVDSTPNNTVQNMVIQALDHAGNVLDIATSKLTPDALPQDIDFEDQTIDPSSIARFKVLSQRSAGATYLMDARSQKKNIGIVASERKERDAPLAQGSYYIRRALEPHARITTGDLSEILERDLSVLILPDIAAMPSETLNSVENWIEKDGGVLIRFAGPNMADTRTHQPFLLPVAIRAGGRSLSGALSWDEPQNIAPITEDSPLYGLHVPDDIEITQQILADPSQELDGKIWARLADGTPFITASKSGKGLIVLVHTTADTRWSNFALSGLFVKSLERIAQMSGRSVQSSAGENYKYLDAELILDGYGNLKPAPSLLNPIDGANIEELEISQNIPPGYYGNGSISIALNLGDHLDRLRSLKDFLGQGVTTSYYAHTHEKNLAPIFMVISLILFLMDWMIMLIFSGTLSKAAQFRMLRAAFILSMTLSASPAFAQETSAAKYANNLYLAYIQTGDKALDTQTMQGLEVLKNALIDRTSAEPAGVVALKAESDDLSFFPLIYWPISERQQPLNQKALQNVQNYLDNGGTIFFDTRDQNSSTYNAALSPRSEKLREITASLNIPPIAPIPEKHVLGRSFYILKEFPGAYDNGVLWVENQSAQGRDNVSSIIVGSNDLGASWAQSLRSAAQDRYNYAPAARQRELALRFGVNLMIYALTGNYKADQVHIDYLLERIGE